VKVNELLAVRVLPLEIVKVPVLELIVKPLMLVARAAPRVGVVNTGLVRVLLVRVSTVFLATNVSLPLLGNVSTPLFEIEEKLGPANDGWLSVAPVAKITAPVPLTAVMPVPLIWNTLPVAAVLNVLLVNVSVVALPTRVSVATGNVNTLEPAVAPDKI